MPARARTRSALAGDTGNAPAAPRPSYLEVPSDEEVLLEHVDGEGPRRVPRRLWGDFGPIAKLEPVRKIKKRSYKPVRPDARPCGRLSFPVEILSATFALLDHEGLDSLTRTNRALRSLLLTRATGLPIYRAVFANLFATGLPKPPLGLTLPAYASLLSIKTCTHCDATHNYTQGYYTVICFASRRRLCRECYQTECAATCAPRRWLMQTAWSTSAQTPARPNFPTSTSASPSSSCPSWSIVRTARLIRAMVCYTFTAETNSRRCTWLC